MGLVCAVAATAGTDSINPRIPKTQFRTAGFLGFKIRSCLLWYRLTLLSDSALHDVKVIWLP